MATTQRPTTDRDVSLEADDAAVSRSFWVRPAFILSIAAVILLGTVIGALLLAGGDEEAPEDVVVTSLEAYNARDSAALSAVLDPNVVVTYDLTKVDGPALPDDVGRETVMELNEEFWANADPTLTWEVLSVDGRLVTTSETATLGDGSSTRHTTVYEVSEDGLIIRMDHIVEE